MSSENSRVNEYKALHPEIRPSLLKKLGEAFRFFVPIPPSRPNSFAIPLNPTTVANTSVRVLSSPEQRVETYDSPKYEFTKADADQLLEEDAARINSPPPDFNATQE